MSFLRPLLVVAFFFGIGPRLWAVSYGPVSVQEVTLAENRSSRTAHGYVEYRFRVTNRNQRAHQVALAMPRSTHSQSVPSLTRSTNRVEVPPESTVMVRLLQPAVEMSGTNEVSVSIDGRLQRDPVPFAKMDQHLVRHGRTSHEIAHVFTSQDVPAEMRDAFRTKIGTPSTTPSPAGDPELVTWLSDVPVEEWSDSWLAYTRFDCVALTSGNWRELQSRRQSVLTALQKYTEAGGMLCIVGTDWQAPEEWPGSGRNYRAVLGSVHLLDGDFNRAKAQINDFRDLVLAQARLWNTAIGDGGLSYAPYGMRTATTSTTMSGNTTLLQLMPVLSNYDVNVKLIMVLIVVFAVLIGPVNIYVLSVLKRRIWLLWTVPVTSLVASLLVLGVSFAQEGFLRQASSATWTVFDQRREEAVSFGFVGFYSTLTPRGVLFSSETEVTPCINRGQYGDNRSFELDLVSGGNQFFSRGWVSARVPAYFAVRKAESQRKERITFDWTGDRPTAVNGLTVPIKHLKVRSPDGELFQADDVPAGPKFELKKIEGASTKPDEIGAMVQLTLAQDSLFRAGPGSGAMFPPEDLPPGTYLAEIEAWNPFVEAGIENMKPFRNTTTIFGIFR